MFLRVAILKISFSYIRLLVSGFVGAGPPFFLLFLFLCGAST